MKLVEDEGEELGEEEHLHLDTIRVSLNSVVGFTPNQTMKVKGMLEGQEMIVLIDNGATHNFIAGRVVHDLCLCLSDNGSFGVTLGNIQFLLQNYL